MTPSQEHEIELFDYLRVIWDRRWLIIGGTLACMVGTLGISLLVPKVYEAHFDFEIGRVWEKPIYDPYTLAEIFNSGPFQEKLIEKLIVREIIAEHADREIVQTNVIEVGERGKKRPVLVRVTTKAASREKARKIAEVVIESVLHQHQIRFDELMKAHYLYQKELDKQVKIINKEKDDLDAILKHQRANSQVTAPEVLLLQAQLEQNQKQWLALSQELRDAKTSNASKAYSENTKVVLPPVVPKNPVSPNIMFNVGIAGFIGLMTSTMLAYLLEYLASMAIRKRTS